MWDTAASYQSSAFSSSSLYMNAFLKPHNASCLPIKPFIFLFLSHFQSIHQQCLPASFHLPAYYLFFMIYWLIGGHLILVSCCYTYVQVYSKISVGSGQGLLLTRLYQLGKVKPLELVFSFIKLPGLPERMIVKINENFYMR